MSQRDPGVLRRILALRQFALLDGATIAELAALAENLVEIHLAAGELVAAETERLAEMYFVLAGRVASGPTAWGPREVGGAVEVLARRGLHAPALATEPTHAYRLARRDLEEILEDQAGLLRALVRDLASRLVGRSPPAPVTRVAPEPTPTPLGFVDRLILLRRQPLLARAGLHALSHLAHDADELELPAATTLVRSGEPPARAFVLVEGRLQARSGDPPVVHGTGEALGFVEALAGVEHARTVEALTPIRVLACTRAAILDVLEDHAGAGLGVLATLAGAVLDEAAREASGP